MRGNKLFQAICAFMLFAPAFAQHRLNDFDVVLPQVAAGSEGAAAVETTIILVNPNPEPVTVQLTSGNPSLLPSLALEMAGFERREVKMSEDQVLAKGWVRVKAGRPLSVSAVMVTRENQGGEEVVSQATVLAEPLAASAVVPVFYRSETIENTGIAAFFRELGPYGFQLFDAAGTLVAETSRLRETIDAPDHLAVFVNELFEQLELPEDFAGWLRLYGDDSQARGLAAMALYTNGTRIVSAQSTVIDAPAFYSLTLGSEDDAPFGELRYQYGFAGGYPGSAPNIWQITASDEIAKALERDPRVVSVEASKGASSLLNCTGKRTRQECLVWAEKRE